MMERHYDEPYYFAERHGGKKWTDREGKTHEFGYAGGGTWNYRNFYDKLVEILGKPGSVLDIGAGCGGWPAFTASQGVDSLGLEFSNFAIDNCVLGAKEILKHQDLAETPWNIDKQYDWVTAIDLFEHVFAEDMDKVVAETKRAANHFIIAKICTAQLNHEVWAAKKASYEKVLEQAHKEDYDWLIVSGHVNSQFPKYWEEKFEDSEWRLRPDLSTKLKRDLNLPDDWRTTLIVERQPPRSDLPKGDFTQEYYDKKYFADRAGKGYRMPDGSLRRWGYMNPDGVWDGCKPIVEAWKTMFSPATLLDAGCGRGQFVAAAREAGILAEGFDYSEYAIGEGRYLKCKPEWLKLHDATRPWPYPDRSFDLVVVLDALEHIYAEDVPKVLQELFRVARKWVFLQIAVSGSGGLQGSARTGYKLRKGEEVAVELEQYAVAGHLTVQNESWWTEMLWRDDFVPRRDLVEQFKGLVKPDVIANWTKNMIACYERVE